MVQIVVTPDQAKQLAEASDSVELIDSQGNRLGFFARSFLAQDIALARARAASNEPRHTTDQVLERLRSLERA